MCPCVYVSLVPVLLRACSFVVSDTVQTEAESNIFFSFQHIFPGFSLPVLRESISLQPNNTFTYGTPHFCSTIYLTLETVEEERRILCKVALRCEYVIRFEDDGKFYFLLETNSDYEAQFARCGWYIVSQTAFNERLTIGMGLYESGHLAGFMYYLKSGSEDEARFWNSTLIFTFFSDFRKAFYPLDNRFQGFFRLDGSLCLYLYDYCPVRRNDKITLEGKKISNLIFRFKAGEETDLSVKLFSIAISRIRVIQENKHRAVLVPIPASTRKKNRIRYEEFCRKLSADIGVTDGYQAITLTADRPQLKGTHGRDKTANLQFYPEYIKDKCVLLIDDLLTTGEGFQQTRRKLIEHGAKFVIGLFLAKTIAFEDEQQ